MENINIQYLERLFIGTGEVEGMLFEKIFESLKGYMYSVNDEGNIRFEVFQIKTTPVCIDFEKRIYSETEFKEIYPKAKDFGIWAWTYSKKMDALEKFIEISK